MHSELPKLHRVLAVLSTTGLKDGVDWLFLGNILAVTLSLFMASGWTFRGSNSAIYIFTSLLSGDKFLKEIQLNLLMWSPLSRDHLS